ncbi:ECF RNA polymerase sigma factor SigK [Actinorugispora endophytica]|uniref:RNA polymerase sigma-70 factor (ECF subfamily) n=1 Tax=Actinorugispora endophytica TaxID=1605990 RepID=A0A4R6UUW1_9ACTN|nr:ECF RNA polymerase sigma factor SigK [Actinorugispora endophytica]TDQ49593.1 RNA polymerase sigma-70 factor (ECF subfamily) [Actinorugispora endophytica]
MRQGVPPEPAPGGGADESRLRAVALGDLSAFEAFYRDLSGPVFGLVQRVLRNHSQAEEVTQEVFVEVWRLAARFDARRGGARSWVLTIAHRRAVDRVRAEQTAADREARAGLLEDRASAADDVPDQVARRLEHERVRRCLGGLTDLQRETVRLTYYTGRTQREAAVLLGVPLTTIKGRLRDGLIRLRDCLGARAHRHGPPA